MSLQLDHTVDLNSQAVLDWIKKKDGSTFEETIEDQDIVAAGLQQVCGSERPIPQVEKVTHTTANNRHYLVLQEDLKTGRELVVGEFRIQVPVAHEIEIGLQSLLYIADSGLTASQKKTIIDA